MGVMEFLLVVPLQITERSSEGDRETSIKQVEEEAIYTLMI